MRSVRWVGLKEKEGRGDLGRTGGSPIDTPGGTLLSPPPMGLLLKSHCGDRGTPPSPEGRSKGWNRGGQHERRGGRGGGGTLKRERVRVVGWCVPLQKRIHSLLTSFVSAPPWAKRQPREQATGACETMQGAGEFTSVRRRRGFRCNARGGGIKGKACRGTRAGGVSKACSPPGGASLPDITTCGEKDELLLFFSRKGNDEFPGSFDFLL